VRDAKFLGEELKIAVAVINMALKIFVGQVRKQAKVWIASHVIVDGGPGDPKLASSFGRFESVSLKCLAHLCWAESLCPVCCHCRRCER
jgi:hypothetical protein